MKQSRPNEHKIKATFTNSAGDKVKELLQTYSDSDPKDLLIELEKELIRIAKRYGMFSDGSWEQLINTNARCLDGRIETIWCDKADDITHASVGNASAQEEKCRAFIKSVNRKYLGKNAADDQKDAMSDGEMYYEGYGHEKAAERLFQINKDLALMNAEVEPFTIREMIRKILPKNLKPKARLRYLDKGGKDKSSADEAIDLCLNIEEYLEEEMKYENDRKQREKNDSNRNYNDSESDQSDDESDQSDEESEYENEQMLKNPCRKHN
eukprot:scaffold108161_cov35-Cyclotella_meneghiniana.AAC.1